MDIKRNKEVTLNPKTIKAKKHFFLNLIPFPHRSRVSYYSLFALLYYISSCSNQIVIQLDQWKRNPPSIRKRGNHENVAAVKQVKRPSECRKMLINATISREMVERPMRRRSYIKVWEGGENKTLKQQTQMQ